MLGRPGWLCEAPELLLGDVLVLPCELVEPVVLCELVDPVVLCEPMEPAGVCDVVGAVPAWPAEDDPAGYCTA